MEKLANEGLCISYKRVEEIETSITKQLCFQYNKNGIVCPPALEYGHFTTAAIDNIDHDPSSTGAKSSFYGTSVSIFQHPESEFSTKSAFKLDENVSSYKNMGLPASYTDIMPVQCGNPRYRSLHSSSTSVDPYHADNQIEESATSWIKALKEIDDQSVNDNSLLFMPIFTQGKH